MCLIPVSLKSVENGKSGRLKISKRLTSSRNFEYLISFQNFITAKFYAFYIIALSRFQILCSFVHKENVLRLLRIIHWLVFYFDYACLIRLCDVTQPTIWPLPLEFISRYSNSHNFFISW